MPEFKVRDKDFVRKPGKTKRDRASGAHERNASNKSERADWCNDSKASAGNFPLHTCNGKRTRALRKRRVSKRA